MKTNKNVLQPMRFVNSYSNFTPIQRDFIMMIQSKTAHNGKIIKNWKIDLRPYFKQKGINLENVRPNHFKEITDNLLESKVTFKYFTGNRLYSSYNLFSHCHVDKDFFLEVHIIDEVLPLFYINKLEEGHFKENQLIIDLFSKNYPNYDTYISFNSDIYVEFNNSITKKLFEKLLQYKTLKKHSFFISKYDLYLLLGFAILKENKTKETSLFPMFDKTYTIEETQYIGNNGWSNLRKKLNESLKEINENPRSGIKIGINGKNYFTTKGRPVRDINIDITYIRNSEYNEDQLQSIEFLKIYGLSEKQIDKIITQFEFKFIKKQIQEHIAQMNDRGRKYFGEYKREDLREIKNVSGYIYAVVFKLNKISTV